MSDLADITDARIELEENLRKIAREKFKPAVAADCWECGVIIPQARQEATNGTDICVSCLSIQEEKDKQYR